MACRAYFKSSPRRIAKKKCSNKRSLRPFLSTFKSGFTNELSRDPCKFIQDFCRRPVCMGETSATGRRDASQRIKAGVCRPFRSLTVLCSLQLDSDEGKSPRSNRTLQPSENSGNGVAARRLLRRASTVIGSHIAKDCMRHWRVQLWPSGTVQPHQHI